MSEVINIKELNERIERESLFVDTLRGEMSKVIVGQAHLVDTFAYRSALERTYPARGCAGIG